MNIQYKRHIELNHKIVVKVVGIIKSHPQKQLSLTREKDNLATKL